MVKPDLSPSAGSTEDAPNTLLRLRLAPHRADSNSSTEILADCPLDHPFYVKDKGRKSICIYGMPSLISSSIFCPLFASDSLISFSNADRPPTRLSFH